MASKMARQVTVASTQMACGSDRAENVAEAVRLVRNAKLEHGADIILLQELFSERYFPQELSDSHFDRAEARSDSELLRTFSGLAKDLEVVLPVSFFERDRNCFYNSVAVFDSDGSELGTYRKSHLPMGPGYEEKYYFSPGNTGFKVFDTKVGRIGVGICWDQWFPEAARAFALRGAEIILYPTAIGSEPHSPELDSLPHWKAVIKGHAAANIVPVVVSNRVGKEVIEHYHGGRTSISFYGSSFIVDHLGQEVEVSPPTRWSALSISDWSSPFLSFLAAIPDCGGGTCHHFSLI